MLLGLIFIALIPIALFLSYVVGSLRGKFSGVAGGALSLIAFAASAITFFVAGWKAGLIATITLFAGMKALYVPGLLVARRIIGYRLPNVRLEPPAKTYSNVADLLKGDTARKAALNRIKSDPSVLRVLAYHGYEPGQIEDLDGWLRVNGIGDIAIEILSTPRDLDLFLWAKGHKTYSAQDICMKLLQWPPFYLSGRPIE